MKRLRIVIDTNVLISAAVKPLGSQALVINLVAFRAVELFVSEAVLDEYREVFSRPKFARLEISPHDSDNRFYECADAAKADYIVTGNSRHFTRPHKNTRIISGRGLLELMAGGPERE